MKRITTTFLLALFVSALWVGYAHAHASYGGDCRQCHSFSNQAPVANAGADKTVTTGAAVALSGAASSDPDDGIASYAWTQTAGPTVTLSNARTVTASFTAPNVSTATVLTFRLTVTDRRPQSASDTINVTVNPAATNQPPTANAGSDSTVVAGATVTLSGAASSDPDDGIGSYAWTQTGGTAVTLVNSNTVSARFTAPNVTASTQLTFRLTVSDRANQTARDTVVITVTPGGNGVPPAANAGLDQTVLPGTFVTLDGFYASDSDNGIASYSWEQIGGAAVILSNPAAVNPIFQAPHEPGVLTFRLVVTDQSGLQSTDNAKVTVLPPEGGPPPSSTNQPPVAKAGVDKTVTAGSRVNLRGGGSSDPDDGIVSYVWAQTRGPRVTLTNARTASASFIAPNVASPTELTFKLTVTDGADQRSSDRVVVTVHPAATNRPPVANAGRNKTVRSRSTVRLSGRASYDPDDGIASYRWRQISGTRVTLTSATTATASFVAPGGDSESSSLVFRLTVRDRAGQRAADTVTVTVSRSGEDDD